MNNSPLSTPPVLTPDTTGTTSVDSLGSPEPALTKAKKRQTAFYPHMNSTNKPQKPFSRSAAKRESVMALGSIEHLQHYFTKTGIAAKKANIAGMAKLGLVPAIGGKNHIRNNSSINSFSDLPLPPSPIIPMDNRPMFPPTVNTYETKPESLLPGVVDDLSSVSRIWEVEPTASTSSPGLLGAKSARLDVLGILKLTTRAVRSVRNYMLALPDESTGNLREQFRSKLAESAPVPTRIRSQAKGTDPLALIRRSALEVLTILRALEEQCRLPLSDDAYDVQSDGGGHAASTSGASEDGSSDIDPETHVAFSLVRVNGREETVMVWEEEEDPFKVDDSELEKKELWDEKLVLGGGYLYRQDIKMEDLFKEQEVVRGYLDIVDEILFGGRREGDSKGVRGWDREHARLAAKQEKAAHRIKDRRVSGGDLPILLHPENRNKRRVVSLGIADSMRGMSLLQEEGMDSLTEEPEEIDPHFVTESDVSLDEDELPLWAQKATFSDDDRLARFHSLLVDFLPSVLIPHLVPSYPEEAFLSSLASGQLLCVAYNAAVRRSSEPWGYISKDSIHDIFALAAEAQEGTGKEGKAWTFRRIDNLRLFTGALKLRYTLPIIFPSTTGASLISPTSPNRKLVEKQYFFDAKIVAKREQGWKEMLQELILAWMDKVMEETRTVRR